MTVTVPDDTAASRKRAHQSLAHTLDKATAGLVAILGHKVRERLERLEASGLDVVEIGMRAEQLADAMVNVLPAPSVAAEVSGPVWTTEQVRVALARDGKPVSRQAIDDRVKRGTLLALQVKEAGERAYPLWQFKHEVSGWKVLKGLAEVLQAVPESDMNRWTLSSWLQQPNDSLSGQSPLEVLVHGDSEHVLGLAKATAERWSH